MKKPRENRVPIMMSDEELTLIDDWRFSNRVATRSDAIRKLCQIGVSTDRRIRNITESVFALDRKFFKDTKSFLYASENIASPILDIAIEIATIKGSRDVERALIEIRIRNEVEDEIRKKRDAESES